MAMLYENERKPLQSHVLNLTDRKRLSISGVEDVEAFDEESVILSTAGGALTVHGSGLKISRLTLDGGELLVEGRIDAMEYAGEKPRSRGPAGPAEPGLRRSAGPPL